MIKIGTNLRNIRELKFLTRRFVSDQLQISLRTYSKIENNLLSPSLDTLEKSAKIFKVTVNTLIFFHEKEICSSTIISEQRVSGHRENDHYINELKKMHTTLEQMIRK